TMQRIPKLHSRVRLRDAWPRLPIIQTPIMDGIGGEPYCSGLDANTAIPGDWSRRSTSCRGLREFCGFTPRHCREAEFADGRFYYPITQLPDFSIQSLPLGSLARTCFRFDPVWRLLAGLLQALLQGGHQVHDRRQLARLLHLSHFLAFELGLYQ